jgi:hypothetical protein
MRAGGACEYEVEAAITETRLESEISRSDVENEALGIGQSR